jgi:hypothetical protein
MTRHPLRTPCPSAPRRRSPGPWPALLALAALLAGCSTFEGVPLPASDRASDLVSLQKRNTAALVDSCLETPTVDCRNRIIRARKAAEDIRFHEFEEGVIAEGRTVGFFATLATLGLTTASAASSGGSAQVMAGLAALITGTRETYSKEVLAEKTVNALFTAMRANRATVELSIRSDLLRPIAEFSLEDGLASLQAYRRAGTVHGALDSVQEVVAVKAQQAEARLLDTFSYKPDPQAQKLRILLCGTSPDCRSLNADAVATMKADCWTRVGVDPSTLILDFMLQESFARQRAATAACLGL